MACWFARLSPALAFLLSVSLCISPILSWYAYADQLYQGQEVERGGEDDRGTGSGDESEEGGAEPQADGEAGAGAEEGEAQKEDFSEAASSGLSALGGGSPLGLDGASEDPYLYWPGGGDDSGSDGLGTGVSGLDFDGSAVPFAGGNVSNNTGFGGGFSGGTPYTRRSLVNSLQWIASGSSTSTIVETFISWFSGSNRELKALVGLNGGMFDALQRIPEWLEGIHAILVDTKNYSVAYLPFVEDQYQLSQRQWGYGYGGTAVVYSNSPAGWLQKLRDYNVNEYYDGYTYSTAKYLAFIFRELERANAKLNYNGSLVGGSVDDYSAARLLARVHNALYGDITYAETGNGGVRSAVSVLGYLANLTYYGNRDLSTLMYRNTYSGGLVGVSGSDTYGTARLLARVHNALYGELTYSETGGTGVRSAVGVLGYLANLTYDTQYTNGKYLETGTTGKRSVSDVALYLANLVFDSSYSHGELLETGTSGKRSAADLTRYTANLVYLLKGNVSSLVDLARADSSFLPKGFADVLSRLDLLHEDMEDGISVDTSGLESRLDEIVRLLLAAGAVENAKDALDALLGDFDTPATSAALSRIQDAMGSAFPFCIPSVVNMVLFGSVLAEPVPPCWEFDIAGTPLVVDFAPYEDFAEVCRWVVRLLFTVSLLMGTRRFVYGFGGGE